jgi:hypothetical protein
MAAAVNNTARQAGGAIGVALIGGFAGAAGFAVSGAALLVGAIVVGAPGRAVTAPAGPSRTYARERG